MIDGTSNVSAPTKPMRRIVAAERQLVCPAFPVSFPLVVNDDLIGEKSLAAMEASWARGTCAAQTVDIFHLRDVYVIDALIFDNELCLIENASVGLESDKVANGLGRIREALRQNAVQQQQSLTVVARRQGGHNYGHFLLEMLPLAVLGKSLYGDADLRYLVPSAPSAMQDVIFRSLRIAGIRPNRLIVQEDITPIHFEEVIAIVGLSEHGTYMSPFSVQAVTSLGSSVPCGPHKKLFVVRTDAGAGQRPLLNQAELQNRLVAKDFVAVDPGSLSFEQQISLFKGADCVVGVFGAAMTNIVFCKPGTSVVSLVPANFPDTFFWFIATHRSLDYMEIRGDQHSYDGDNAWIEGFTIREHDIRFLEGLAVDSVAALVRAANVVSNVTIVHIQGVGDLRGVGGRWAGRRGSGHWIEGVAIIPPGQVAKDQLRYQVILHDGTDSAWVEGETFVGSRGQSQPMRGFRLLLRDEAALCHTCCYEATFTDGSHSRLFVDGELCATSGMTPLEALRVEIRPRGARFR